MLKVKFANLTGFPDTERAPLLQAIVAESRQYASTADHISTFFTPMDSPNHSDDEDISRKPEAPRRLSKSSELFMSLTKLSPEKVGQINFSLSLSLLSFIINLRILIEGEKTTHTHTHTQRFSQMTSLNYGICAWRKNYFFYYLEKKKFIQTLITKANENFYFIFVI